MAGVCYSVRMYEDTNFNLLAHLELLRVRSGSQISSLGCRDADGSSEAETREMSYLPTCQRWWALVRVCVPSEVRKEVSWILFEFSQRQSPSTTSVVWPKLMMHGIPWQQWGKCQGQQWPTKVPLLAWSDVQGVLTLTGSLDVGHCGGLSEPHARSPTAPLLLHTALPEEVWIMPRVIVGLWNEDQGYGHSLVSPWTC